MPPRGAPHNVARLPNSMKIAVVLLATLLLASNLFWLYREFDQGVTEQYRNQERYEAANRMVATSALASEAVRGKSKEQAEALLRRLFPKEQVFTKEGAIRTTWIALSLTPQDQISGVEVDSENRKQSEPGARAVVGNEVFWPKK